MLVDDPLKAFWFVVLFIVLQQVEGNLIYPHVVGNSVGLPSIWVLAAVTVGGSLMGVLGMLIYSACSQRFMYCCGRTWTKRIMRGSGRSGGFAPAGTTRPPCEK